MHTPTATLEQLGENRPSSYRGVLRDDVLARELYSEGAGIARTLPLAVAVPADTADLCELVRWARTCGHSLMPRGSASGMAAGAIGSGIAVDLSRMNAIGDVNVAGRCIRVGAGAVRGAVDAAARMAGLRFPVDPSSGAFCTIGGMVSTNAAGARSLLFGATRAWVKGIECVFDDGSVAWVRRGEPTPLNIPAVARLSRTLEIMSASNEPGATAEINALSTALVHKGVRKESSGYAIASTLAPDGDFLDLLVGSEGTLAIFTQIELALIPVAGATGSLLALFDSLEAATECALRAREFGVSACELLDRTFLTVAASQGALGVPANAEAVLLVEVEGEDTAMVAAATDAVAQTFRIGGARDIAVGLSRAAQDDLWSLRHAASPILSSLAPRLRSMQFIEDGCVPPDNLPAYVRGVRAVMHTANFSGVIFGHAGDAHIHVNPLVDVNIAGWRDRVRRALLDVCELTHQLGGTIAGEHGDGRLRAPILHRVWSSVALAAFANIKAAADPAGVLNAGCKISASARPVDVIGSADDLRGELRHDPAARPLSATARTVLDRIEHARAWNQFRLDEIAAGAARPAGAD